jgi:FkbM family methyltransferase
MNETFGKLIFDIGCHTGEDADFYLKKGFRVVAVEANPDLISGLKAKFAAQLASGQFTLVDKAIADKPGTVEFYLNQQASIFGTIRADAAARHDPTGAASRKIVVPAITFGSLIETYGVPYYLKIDIEGADMLCLEGLLQFKERPAFVSHEHEQSSFADIFSEVKLLKALGYTRFQASDMGQVHNQQSPNPPREGTFVPGALKRGSSGLFGEELPGPWLTSSGIIAKYIGIYLANKSRGAVKKVPGLRDVMPEPPGAWYDTHATR